MLLANCLFFGGAIAAILGIINIINFSKASIVKVIICGVLIVGGAGCCLVGNSQRQNTKVAYEVYEVTATNNDGTNYRVTLKAGSNSTILYLDKEDADKFVQGETVKLTKQELKKLTEN